MKQARWHMAQRCTGLLAIGLLVLLVGTSACGARATNQPATAASGGEQIFQTRCAVCHAPTTEKKVGPGLAGVLAPGGPQLPAGVDYGGKLPNGAERTEANVAAWIRTGGRGQIGIMPAVNLNDQQMADLIGYLNTLK